jgi:hypothetical protein
MVKQQFLFNHKGTKDKRKKNLCALVVVEASMA